MVNASVADLIAECDNIAVFVAEGAAHKVVAEIAAYGFGVGCLTGLLVSVAELIIAPRYHRSCISLGKSELYMVSCVVKAAGYVNKTVAVGVEYILVLCHERLGKIGSAVFVVNGVHRHL